MWVEAEAGEDGGGQVARGVGVGGGVLAEAVAFAVHKAAFHASSGEDDGVALRPVVSAAGADVVDDRVRAADVRLATELAAPHDQRVGQQAALVKVFDERREALVFGRHQRLQRLEPR